MYRAVLASAAVVVCAPACKGPSVPEAPSITGRTRDSHDRFFPIAAGPHAVDCNSCHGSADTFKQFDCLGCHAQVPTSQGHAAVAGFVYASAGCLQCHPRGTSSFVHAGFPVAQGDKHALGRQVALGTFTGAVACQACLAVRLRLLRAMPLLPADERAPFREGVLKLTGLHAQVVLFGGIKRLMRVWRTLHASLAVLLVRAIAAHVAVSLYLGYGLGSN